MIEKLVYVAQLGSRAVLYILLALSVLSIGVIFERWWYFRRRRMDVGGVADKLRKLLRTGDVTAARATLSGSKAVEAEVINEALGWYDDGPEAVEQILAKAVRQRRKGFEAGLLFLGTLGNNAPFIGLFGTVLGIVTAFRELGQTQAGASAGMGNVMAGIAEALVATAIGILVALPAVIFYNVFQKKGADVEENAASLGNVVLASMKTKSASRAGGSAGVVSAPGNDAGTDPIPADSMRPSANGGSSAEA